MERLLDDLNVPRSTFYRWYKQYQEDGLDGLINHRPNPGQIWNRIPPEVKQQVVELALQHPDRSPRQIAWPFADPHLDGLRSSREPSFHGHQCRP